MINLLPEETKKQLHAAHTNVLLVKYLGFLGIAVAFLVITCGLSYLLLSNNKSKLEQLEENSQSTVSLFSIAQKQLDTIHTNISNAKNIMDQQVTYSDIITSVAAALPTGIIIDKLTVNNASIGKSMVITAHAKTADLASQLKDNFAKSPLFSNFVLQSVTNTNSSQSAYPVVVSISVTIIKGNS